MFTTAQLLCALLLPALLAVVLSELMRQARAGSSVMRRRAVSGLVILVTAAVAHVATAVAVDARLMPPLLGWHWLPWVMTGLVPFVIWTDPMRSISWRWLAHAVATAAGMVVVLLPLAHCVSPLAMAVFAGIAALYTALYRWSERQFYAGPIVEHVSAGIASGTVALGALLCGSKDLALLAGILPAAVLGSGIVQLIRRDGGTGLGLAIGPLIAWHLAINVNYSEMPWWTALLLAAPVPLGAIGALLGRSPRHVLVLRIGITVVTALIAVALAATLAQPGSAVSESPDSPTDHY